MGTPQIVNTVEVISELWTPISLLIQQSDGSFSLRLVLRDARVPSSSQTTRVDPGKVIHVPVWYGMPWEPVPGNGIPLEDILAAAPGNRLVGTRR